MKTIFPITIISSLLLHNNFTFNNIKESLINSVSFFENKNISSQLFQYKTFKKETNETLYFISISSLTNKAYLLNSDYNIIFFYN